MMWVRDLFIGSMAYQVSRATKCHPQVAIDAVQTIINIENFGGKEPEAIHYFELVDKAIKRVKGE